MPETITFTIWEVDEPEFVYDTEAKFKMLLHPVDMTLGTGGKNDRLAKETVNAFADWALRKLLRATVKVAFWAALTIAGRFVKRDFRLGGRRAGRADSRVDDVGAGGGE